MILRIVIMILMLLLRYVMLRVVVVFVGLYSIINAIHSGEGSLSTLKVMLRILIVIVIIMFFSCCYVT